MSELNEKVEEPQGQPSERAPIPAEKLEEILEAHRRWVESEGKEGERANLGAANLQKAVLFEANLQGADLQSAKLQGADLRLAQGLTASQLLEAKNWELAFYRDDFLKKLGLPPDHNERVKKKLAEMEKETKATDAQ